MWAGAAHSLRSFPVFFGIALPPADRGQPGGTAGSLRGSWGACGLQLSPGTTAVEAAAIPPEVRFILGDSPITRQMEEHPPRNDVCSLVDILLKFGF